MAGPAPGALDPADAPGLAAAALRRSQQVVTALRALGSPALTEPSTLPGWDRLTVACHLRYGARASRRVTREALAGRPASFYPGGRAARRPATLRPGPGEGASEVVDSLAAESAALGECWAPLAVGQWARAVREEAGTTDLGVVPLAMLALLRLTEVEVHGTDLDLGLADWSDVFVTTALPVRLGWLATRRSNQRPVDPEVEGRWLLAATDGPAWRVGVRHGQVTSEPAEHGSDADAVLEGSARDILATLLGRPPHRPLQLGGDRVLAAAFGRAFPGP